MFGILLTILYILFYLILTRAYEVCAIIILILILMNLTLQGKVVCLRTNSYQFGNWGSDLGNFTQFLLPQ